MSGAYAYTPAIWPPLVAAVLLAAIGLYAWRRRDAPGAKPFVAISVLSILILLGIAFEAAAVAPAMKLAWYKFQFVLLVVAVTAVTCFVLDYAYPGRWLTRRNVILLSIPGLLCLIMAVINDSQLIWRQLEGGADGSVMLKYAPAGAILVAYGIGMALFYLAVFLRLFVRSPRHRWPVALMLLGQFVSRILFLLDNAHPPALSGLDLMTLSIVWPWTTYAIAIFGFHILDPLPAARRTVIEQMRAGMVVFDAKWHVVSLNPAAERILGVRAGAAHGKTWQQLAPQTPLPALPDGERPAPAAPELPEMTFGSGSDARHYEPALSPLWDTRGLLMGYSLMLRDVTEQKRAQAQLLEQQRSLAVLQERERLARELHDELGQVLGYVKMQAQAARNQLAPEQNATADEYLAQLISVAQDAHDDVRDYILGAKAGAGGQLGFLPALEAYLQQFTAHYGIRTELVVAPGLRSGDFEPMVQVQLQRIIQEALTNARKHGHAHCVQVRFQRADGGAQITVQDDGVGFDPELQATSEGGHFGLRFLQERAQEVHGRVAIVSSPGRGTRVEVAVPVTQRTGEGAPEL
jgi:PAS domain S-box-containing protein